jgi:thioredoxin 1
MRKNISLGLKKGSTMKPYLKTSTWAAVALLGMLSVCTGADVLLLNDGKKIAGFVTQYSDATFTLKTSSGGELKEPASEVSSIEFADSATPVSLDMRPNGTINTKVLQFENAKFVVASSDGEIQKIPVTSVASMQWGKRPPVAERLAVVVRPHPVEDPPTGEHPSKIDLVRGNTEVKLEDHLVHGKVTVVDFYADWCGPCRKLSPHLEDMAAHDPEIALVKINILDWRSPVAKQFGITAIPRVQVYGPWGKLVGTSEGVRPQEIEGYVKQAKSR